MTLWLIVGLFLLLLGGILVFVLQMPEMVEQRKKKKRSEAPAEPPKDWEAIAARAEKRVQSLEQSLRAIQNEIKDRDKRAEELTSSFNGLKKQLDQEKTWREKEEAAVEKEKKQERILQEELVRTRTALDQESTSRIKLENEHKEFRKTREEQSTQIRQLNTKGMDLDRRLNEALKELAFLRDENVELKRKKEDDQWVAKSDYKRLEALLKRARWEAEQFKRKIPQDQWPNALKPRASAPLDVATPLSSPSSENTVAPVVELPAVTPSSENVAPAPETPDQEIKQDNQGA